MRDTTPADLARLDIHRQVFEKNRAVQLLVDPASGLIVGANPAACVFYGYSCEELVGKRIADLEILPSEDVNRAAHPATPERRGASVSRHRLATGEVRDVEVDSGPVEVDGRQLLYSIVHDVSSRRRAEEALRERETDFQVLFAAHPHPMWVCDLETLIFLEVNEAAVTHYGYSREEFLHMRATDIRPDADVARFMNVVGGLRRELDHSGEWQHRRKDGTLIDVLVLSHVLEFAGRRAALVVAQDVTERNRAQEALRQSEEKYRAILEGIDEGYYEVDLDGRFTFVNDALCRYLGYSREELLGVRIPRFTSQEDERRMLAAFESVMRTGRPARYMDFVVQSLSATDRTLEASMSLRLDREGRPVGMRGVVLDVTERRYAEAALRESEERYRKLVELSPDGIAIHSEGRVVFTNSAGRALMGARTSEEVLGKPAVDFVHPESRPLVAARMKELAAGRPVPVAVEKFVRLDGSVIDVEVGAIPFTYQDRPAAQVVFRDLSERKRTEMLETALFRIAQTSGSVAEISAFYAEIHAIVGELMYARSFCIALRNPATGGISFEYVVDEVEPGPPPPAGQGNTLTEYVLRTGHPLLASPEVLADLVARGEVVRVGPDAVDWLGVPLKRGSEAFGVLVVQSYTDSVRFTEKDREVLTFVAQHVAAALDRKRATDALLESEERFRTLAETAPCAIVIYHGEVFSYVNAAAAAITGYSRDELMRVPFRELVHPEFREVVKSRGLARQRGENVPLRYEFKIVRKDGHARWLDFSAASIESDGRPAALGIAFDVSERKRAEEQIKSLAYHDTLTGLPNRLLFTDRLSLAVAQAHRLGQRLGILFLDLDRFKVINDSLGHSLGDRLLQGVAQRLETVVREGDTVARLGGDEFILLLPGVARAEDAAKVAEKLLESLKLPFRVEGRELFVTASIGISLYPEDGIDGEALVKNADTAMYRAKEQGRDSYRLYTHAMNEQAVEHLALESSLRKALTNGELVLHYQPLLDLTTGRVHGLEALLRWQHPERGLLHPSDFMSLAEVTGLILPIGPWVLRTACAQTKAWQDEGHAELSIAVNLSARQFQQADLVAEVKVALEGSGLPPRCLDLEITESHAMHNAEATILTLRELKGLGVRVSIDDFGIGYSSLSYLKRLPIDTLKIDQSFVRDITTDPDDAAIATAVIALAHTLKLRVVAEGVETEDQLAFLTARHCDRMQGYLFSVPLAARECGEFLARSRR